jgi:hypothetical protein
MRYSPDTLTLKFSHGKAGESPTVMSHSFGHQCFCYSLIFCLLQFVVWKSNIY